MLLNEMTPAGLEPAIPGSVGRCLIHWATGPMNKTSASIPLKSKRFNDNKSFGTCSAFLGLFAQASADLAQASSVFFDIAGNDAMHMNYSRIMCRQKKAPPVGLEPTIFGLEVRRLVH